MESEVRAKYVIQGRRSCVVRDPESKKRIHLTEGARIPEWVSQRQLDEWIAAGYAVRDDDPAYAGVIKFPELRPDGESAAEQSEDEAAAAAEAEREEARRRAAAARADEKTDDPPQTRRQKAAAGTRESAHAGGPGTDEKAKQAAQVAADEAEEAAAARAREAAAAAEEAAQKRIAEAEAADEPRQKGVWTHAPEDLGEKSLEQLQVLVAERIEKYQLEGVDMPESVEDCIELLTSEYDPAFRNQG